MTTHMPTPAEPGRTRRRAILTGVSGLAGATALAACGPTAGGGSETASQSTAPAKVRIIGTFVDATKGEELWRQWRAQLAEKEKVDAEFIIQPTGNIPDKLLAQVAGGDIPDVTQGTNLEYAARGLLADLTARIKQDKIVENRKYFKKAVEAAQFEGKYFAMPGGLSPYVYWTNLDMLRSVGLEAPRDGKMTFDDFVRFCKAVTKDTDGDGKPDQWGYDADTWFSRLPPIIWGNGGDMFEYTKTTNLAMKPIWDRPETVQAIQWQADLVLKEQVFPRPQDTAAVQAATFVGGKRLFDYGGGFKTTEYRDKIGTNFRWAALRAPVKRAGDKPQEMVPAFLRGSILKDSKVKDGAWRALRYISGPEGNVGYRQFVTDELIFDTPEEINRFVTQSPNANIQLMVDAAREAGERPFNKSEPPAGRVLYGWASEMVPAMNEEFKALYEGTINAQGAVAKLNPRLQAVIDKGKGMGIDPEKPAIKLG
jgi:multiple sugar transport system substrate-binding protein